MLDDFDWDSAEEAIQSGPWISGGYWSSEWKRMVEPGVPYRKARLWTLLMLTRWAEHWLSA